MGWGSLGYEMIPPKDPKIQRLECVSEIMRRPLCEGGEHTCVILLNWRAGYLRNSLSLVYKLYSIQLTSFA